MITPDAVTGTNPARMKAISNRVHARTRAMERYGIDLTPDLAREWERRVRSGDGAVMLADRHGGQNRVLYAVKHDDEWLPVVYDAATASVVTLPPPHALDRYRRGLEPRQAVPPVPAGPKAPFVGRVVGFVPVPVGPWDDAGRAMDGLPELAAADGADDASRALAARRSEVLRRMATTTRGYAGQLARSVLDGELQRLAAIRRAISASRPAPDGAARS